MRCPAQGIIERLVMKKEIKDLFGFIKNSPCCYQAVDEIRKRLLEAGFTELFEQEAYQIKEGGKYFVTRNDSSLIAFCLPKEKPQAMHIIAAHDDSPCFKLKEEMNMQAGPYVKLNVEKYGGMIYSTWFDRPLGVAGRAVIRDGDGLRTVLYDSDRDIAIIPSIAIHMERDINDSHKYSVQKELMPVVGNEGTDFNEILAKDLGVNKDDILGRDLFLYNRQTPVVWGDSGQFIGSPRLDDLECVYAGLRGIIEAESIDQMSVLAIFDNEEVGSGTKQGADSTFLTDTLKRAVFSLGMGEEDFCRLTAASLMISADNAHGYHPNYAEKADEANRPHLNGGIVIKHSANQKYTTDASSAAAFKLVCENAGVPYQTFVNRSDIAGGSTLGNISTTHLSVSTVDIGLSQWAMHSAYESAGVEDAEYLIKASKTFYSMNLIKTRTGWESEGKE